MASLRDIKRRIDSVRSTQKITRAMKMVAAAKLRRAQDAIVRARPYAQELGKLVDALVLRADAGAHPLLRQTLEGKVVLLVFTSDRGLCGGFNASIVNETMRLLRGDFANREVELIVVGRKGVDLFRRRNCTLRETHIGLLDGDSMEASRNLVDGIVQGFIDGTIGELYCVFNEFRSALTQTVSVERLLPLERSDDTGVVATDYLYEPSMETVLERLLIHDLYIQMHRMIHESAASEHGARMTAMESATNNASDMIERLTLQYNRARQDAITKEMLEIIGGAEAL